MAEQEIKKPEQETKPQVPEYTYDDLLKFQKIEGYSGFGKMILSTKQTSPQIVMPKCSREQAQKIFTSKELAKLSMVGKGPGAQYQVDAYETLYYKKDPNCKFGKSVRSTLDTGSKYDYYLRQDVDFDPLEADKSRKQKSTVMRIGLESRFQDQIKKNKQTPGHIYNPSMRHEIQNPPKFSFGYRREQKGQSYLIPQISTSPQVGPNSYMVNKLDSSVQNAEPKFSFPRAPKFGGYNHGWDKYQTYDMRSKSIGPQVSSKKKSMPTYSFGKMTRERTPSIFKQDMSNPQTSIRISHPQF